MPNEKPVDQTTPQERAVELARMMGWGQYTKDYWHWPREREAIVYPSFFVSDCFVRVHVRRGKFCSPEAWQPESDRNDLAEAKTWALAKFPKQFSLALIEEVDFSDFLTETDLVRLVQNTTIAVLNATPTHIVTAILEAGRKRPIMGCPIDDLYPHP